MGTRHVVPNFLDFVPVGLDKLLFLAEILIRGREVPCNAFGISKIRFKFVEENGFGRDHKVERAMLLAAGGPDRNAIVHHGQAGDRCTQAGLNRLGRDCIL